MFAFIYRHNYFTFPQFESLSCDDDVPKWRSTLPRCSLSNMKLKSGWQEHKDKWIMCLSSVWHTQITEQTKGRKLVVGIKVPVSDCSWWCVIFKMIQAPLCLKTSHTFFFKKHMLKQVSMFNFTFCYGHRAVKQQQLLLPLSERSTVTISYPLDTI